MELGYLNQIVANTAELGDNTLQLRFQYVKSRASEIKDSFKETFAGKPNKRSEVAKTAGVTSLLALQYTVFDEYLLTRLGVGVLETTGNPIKTAAVVATANWAEHYLAGKAAEKTMFPPVFEKTLESKQDEDISGVAGKIKKLAGKYGVSLFFGTGPDVAVKKSRNVEVEKHFSAKSASVIATCNIPVFAGIATAVEATNSTEFFNDNWATTAWLFGFIALSIPKNQTPTKK